MNNTTGRSQNAEWHIELRKALDRYFNEEDIEVLCFDLHIDCESLSGETKSRRIVSLIQVATRTGRINDLIDTCSRYRPNVPWYEIKAAAARDLSAGDLQPEFDDELPTSSTAASRRSTSTILGIQTKWIVVFIVVLGVATVATLVFNAYRTPPGGESDSHATQTAQAIAALTATAGALTHPDEPTPTPTITPSLSATEAVAAESTLEALEDSDEDGDSLTYLQETTDYSTDPNNYDTDDDGLGDGEEVNDHSTDATNPDTDGDGLDDGDEIARSTDPNNPDTDGDGLDDGDEIARGTDPNNSDTDGDGLDDGDEIANGTDATNPDTDGDDLDDGDEIARGTDATNPDTDGDDLDDGDEIARGTDATNPDTDGDDLDDGDEIANGTDATNPDTDGDGLDDGDEIANGTNAQNPDTDGDGLDDGDEMAMGTDARSSDSDGDGVSDGDEVARERDPNTPSITFTHFPNGSSITRDTFLTGDEFVEWGVHVAGAPESSYCNDARYAAVIVDQWVPGKNVLSPTSQGETTRCNGIPISITFTRPVREVRLIFGGATVAYEMKLYDGSGALIATRTATPAQVGYSGETYEIGYQSSGANIRRVVFGHETASTAIVEIIYE